MVTKFDFAMGWLQNPLGSQAADAFGHNLMYTFLGASATEHIGSFF